MKKKLPKTLVATVPLVLFTGLLYLTGVFGDLPFILSILFGLVGVWRFAKGKVKFHLPGKNPLLFALLFLVPYFAGWAVVVLTEPQSATATATASQGNTYTGPFHEIGVAHTVEVAVARAWFLFLPLTSEFGFILPYHVLYTVLAVISAVGLSRRVTVA